MTWYCPKCRITFQVGTPNALAERLGCPDCWLWFHTGTKQTKRVANMTVTPEDLARHKRSFRGRPSVHESYAVEMSK